MSKKTEARRWNEFKDFVLNAYYGISSYHEGVLCFGEREKDLLSALPIPDPIENLLDNVGDPVNRLVAADRLEELGRNWEASLLRNLEVKVTISLDDRAEIPGNHDFATEMALRISLWKKRVISLDEVEGLRLMGDYLISKSVNVCQYIKCNTNDDYSYGCMVLPNIEEIVLNFRQGGLISHIVKCCNYMYEDACDHVIEKCIPFHTAVATLLDFDRTTPLQIPVCMRRARKNQV